MWNLNKNAANIAFCDDKNNQITYKDIFDWTLEIKRKLNDRSLIFILCTNTIGSCLGYAAFIECGMVPLLLNANMNYELLENLVEKYEPQYLWVPVGMEDIYNDYDSECSKWDYVLLKTNNTGVELNPELCLLLTTSGSTGSPKLVRQSYRNVLENAKSIVEYLHLDASERPITTLPMNYTYGLSVINSHLLVGATILVTDKGIMQKEFWQFLKNKAATSIAGVPYTYEMLDKLRFYRMELSSIRYMTQAGGKLSASLHKKFAEYAKQAHKKFIVMYGQCEATARMSYLPSERSIEKCGSIGIAIPGGKFSIIDDDGQEIIDADMPGELIYEGANVTLGYAESAADLSKGDERCGILRTGDLAKRDADGFYYIVGRKKRFLKIYGNRVNLDEVDSLLKEKYKNIEIVCTGYDDHMYICTTSGNYADDIRDFVSKVTKLNPAAFTVFTIESIPKNDSGKIMYSKLNELMEDGKV